MSNVRFLCVGISGNNCEIDSFNECTSNPCLNNGNCQDRLSDYACFCPRGFTGKNCDISDPKSRGGLGTNPFTPVC